MTRTTKHLEETAVADRSAVDDHEGFGVLQTERGGLPLVAMDVRAQLWGLMAQITVKQTFRNSLDQPLEATYIFPLPDRAAVTSFRMKVADRVIEGQLKERGEARQQYDQAIKAGHRAAIAEEERSGTFSLRVGNIPAKEQVTIELSLVGPLTVAGGEATFRFPLVVAPRYVPGVPLDGPPVGSGWGLDTDEVPDASRVTPPVLLPGFPNPVQLSLEVELDPAGLYLKTDDGAPLIHSSLHSIILDDGPPWTIRLQPGERLNRDFILRFPVSNEQVQTALLCSPAADGKTGVFALTLVPPAINQNHLPAPRDVVVVLDRSGSMQGWKMVAARRAVGRMIDTLLEQDRFAVIAFDDTTEYPDHARRQLVEANDRNRWRTLEWLGKIEARGGTEMRPALQESVGLLATEDLRRQRIVVLITDGQVTGEDAVLKGLRKSVGSNMPRIHTLGIDRAVNEGFLRRLAQLGGGTCDVVESEDRLDQAMDHIHHAIGQPALTQLRLEPIGFKLLPDSLTPSKLPDLFADRPLTIFGQYAADNALRRIRICGLDAAGHAWQQEVEACAKPVAAAGHLWGRARIRELEDCYAAGSTGNPEALARQIVDVSLAANVLSRFTAYVAVDVSEVVNRGGKQEKAIQPVEMPDGWEMQPNMLADSSSDFCLCAMEANIPRTRTTMKFGRSMTWFAKSFSVLRKAKITPPTQSDVVTPEDLREALEELQHFERMNWQELTRTLEYLVVLLEEWANVLKDEKHAAATEAEKLAKCGREMLDDARAGKQGALSTIQLKEFLAATGELLDSFDTSKSPAKRKSFWK